MEFGGNYLWRDEMIKKLMLVVFVLNMCVGCGRHAHTPLDNNNFTYHHADIIREGNSFLKCFNGTSELVLFVDKDFNLDREGSGGYFFNKDGAYLSVENGFFVNMNMVSRASESSIVQLGSLFKFVTIESKEIDKNNEYEVCLVRLLDYIAISYNHVIHKPFNGWIELYRISYREKLPPEFHHMVEDNNFKFEVTYMEDFKKRARSSFTIPPL